MCGMIDSLPFFQSQAGLAYDGGSIGIGRLQLGQQPRKQTVSASYHGEKLNDSTEIWFVPFG